MWERKSVSGTSEEMFNAVHRDTCKDERRIGRETPVVRKMAVWDTGRGEKVFVGYPRRWSKLYLVTPGRRKIKSGETGSGADCC